jgi:hypothetical protein
MFSGMLHCVPTLHRHNIANYSPFFPVNISDHLMKECQVTSIFLAKKERQVNTATRYICLINQIIQNENNFNIFYYNLAIMYR